MLSIDPLAGRTSNQLPSPPGGGGGGGGRKEMGKSKLVSIKNPHALQSQRHSSPNSLSKLLSASHPALQSTSSNLAKTSIGSESPKATGLSIQTNQKEPIHCQEPSHCRIFHTISIQIIDTIMQQTQSTASTIACSWTEDSWSMHSFMTANSTLTTQETQLRWLSVLRAVLSFHAPEFESKVSTDNSLGAAVADLVVVGADDHASCEIPSRVHLNSTFQQVVAQTATLLQQAQSTSKQTEASTATTACSFDQDKVHELLARQTLTLVVAMSPKSAECRFVYSFKHHSKQRIASMARCMSQLVTSINESPAKTPLSSLTLLPQDMLTQVQQWSCSKPQVDGYRSGLMHSQFMDHAIRDPNKVAVVYGENTMTYGQLRQESNRLARLLQSLGVKPDTRVGLFLDRSCYIVLCQLGVLRAGGAFVPIGLNFPRDRVLDVLQDAEIDVLLSVSWLEESVQALGLDETLVQVVYADMDVRLDQLDGTEDVASEVAVTNLAYLIYTSGTTGRPKGVMIEHRNISAYVQSYSSVLQLTSNDVVSCLHEYIFDFSVGDVWLCMSAGGKLVGFSRDLLMAMDEFCRVVQQHQVTYLTITPALFSLFVEYDLHQDQVLSSLRLVDIGGDAVQYDVVSEWLAKYGPEPPVVVNGYGPTEASICCAWEFFSTSMTTADGHTQSRIGKPLPLYYLYVVNGNGMLLPPGVAGELWIGGEGVGRGYLNRPELTSDKFIRNPFGEGSVYKSGDLCAWNDDGSLAFFGRIDHQVKLRGFRIELGEIESVMRRVASVQRSAVCVKNSTLVGYVVPRDVDTEAVLEACRAQLPSYMVPCGVVALDAFPLTTNGKLDQTALPDLASSSAKSCKPGLVVFKPVTKLQKLLVKLVANELQLDETCIDLNKSFASFGGNSISAVRIGLQLQKTGFPIPGLTILNCTSLKALETTMGCAGEDENAIPISKLRAQGNENLYGKPLLCSFGQEQFLISREAKGHDTENNMPQLLKMKGQFDVECFRRSLEQVVHRHEILRTTYAHQEPFDFKQIIHKSLEFELVVDAQSYWGSEESEIVKQMVVEVSQTIDIYNRGPLRVVIHQVSEFLHYVLINIHHTMYDGVSLIVMNEELYAFYDHFARNGVDAAPLQMAAPALQFYDFAEWQHEQLASGNWRVHEEFYRQRLQNVRPMNLPYIPGSKAQADQHMHNPKAAPAQGTLFCIPEAHVRVLRAIAKQNGLTLFVAMLTLMKMVLASACNEKEILMGVVSACREQSNVDQCLGFFVNGVPLLTTIDLHQRFQDILQAVATTVKDTMKHHEYPLLLTMRQFDHLVSSQLAQVFLLYQDGVQVENAQIGGQLEVEEVPILGEVPTMFDLQVEMIPQANGSVQVGMGYDPQVFDAKTIDVIAASFTTISGIITATNSEDKLCIPPIKW